jgi:thiamine transport system substrate-binding protein
MSRALAEDIFEPYQSALLDLVPDSLELDETYRLIPVDYGDVCLNYDIDWFVKNELNPPTTLTDLTQPAYERLTVVENPATSSPGLAFLRRRPISASLAPRVMANGRWLSLMLVALRLRLYLQIPL